MLVVAYVWDVKSIPVCGPPLVANHRNAPGEPECDDKRVHRGPFSALRNQSRVRREHVRGDRLHVFLKRDGETVCAFGPRPNVIVLTNEFVLDRLHGNERAVLNGGIEAIPEPVKMCGQ
jgi:hypothetical protein